MNPHEILKYQQEVLHRALVEGIRRNEEQRKIWKNYKSRHEKVISGLETIPSEVSISCMVPIGKRALMKGKLVHTNEILVCLGEGYFAKYSAARAIALCKRRIQTADEMLKSLDTERNLLEMRQIIPLQYNAFGKEESKDIIEYWDEGDLNDWRSVHRQKEKEYHQKLSELRKKERTKIDTEEDLFKRLDELEIEEELEDEMNRLEEERRQFYGEDLEEGEVYYESDEEDTSLEGLSRETIERELEKLKSIQLENSINNLHTDTDNRTSNNDSNMQEQEEGMDSIAAEEKQSETERSANNNKDNKKHVRRVSFAEPRVIEEASTGKEKENSGNEERLSDSEAEEGNDVIKIQFKHSDENPVTPENNGNGIETPYDIYKIVPTSKSILKRSPGDINYNQNIPPPPSHSSDEEDKEDEEDEDDADKYIKPSAYKSIVKNIQEKTVEVLVKDNDENRKQIPRPVSKFRMRRQNK